MSIDNPIGKKIYNTVSKADSIIDGRALGTAVSWTTDQVDALEEIIKHSDVVVAMIPRSGHGIVAELWHLHNLKSADYRRQLVQTISL